MREKVGDWAGEIKNGVKEGWLFENQLIYFTSTGLRGPAPCLSARYPSKEMRDRRTGFLKKQLQQKYQTLGHSTKGEVLATRPS